MSDKPPFVPGMTPQEIWQAEQHWNASQAAQATANQALALAQQAGVGSSTTTIISGGSDSTTTSGVSLSNDIPTAETAGATGAAGTSATAAHSDHVHAMPSSFPVVIQSAGATIGTRATLNFVSGATVADNPGAGSVDVTVSGGGGWTVVSALPAPSSTYDNQNFILRQTGLKDQFYVGAHNAAGASRFSLLASSFPLNKLEPAAYTAALERWFCNDTSGSTLTASVATPTDDLTLSTANMFGSDSFGNYFAPANTSYAIGTAASAALTGTGDFSVEAEVATGATLSSYYICAQGKDTAVNADIIFELGLSGSGVIFQMYRGSTQVTLTGSFTPAINTVYHVFVTYVASSGLMTAYVNGSSVGTQSLGGTRNNPGSLKTNIGGRDGTHSTTYQWNGKIYFVSFYNRAVGSSEVNARYNNL